MNTTHATLSTEQQTTLLALLKAMFLLHMNRHEGLFWTAVEQRLMTQPQKLYTLSEMGVLLVAGVSAMTKLLPNPNFAELHRAMLESEGIVFLHNGRIDMKRYAWKRDW